MKPLTEIANMNRFILIDKGADGGCGEFYVNGMKSRPLRIVYSNGGGWEHVSASFPNRCPTWEEMCKVKDAFFYENECVVQYHPPKSEYVNMHPYCLHLWRKIGQEFETPPSIFVGLK